MRNILKTIWYYLSGQDAEPETPTINISILAEAIHKNAVDKGFYDVIKLCQGMSEQDRVRLFTLVINEKLLLIHSEVTEVMDEFRQPEPNYEKIGRELADVIVRTIDVSQALDLDIEQTIIDVTTDNLQRPKMHGGKRF